MTDIKLSGLFIYPVKSLPGISLQDSVVDSFGLTFDRRWMLVDADGLFLSQRQLPRMALIDQQIHNAELVLQAAGQDALSLPLRPSGGAETRVKVWDHTCVAWDCGAEAMAWFSGFLERPCRLVYMPDDHFRPVDQTFAEAQDQTAFSDGFPLLLISEGSLTDLNRRLTEPITMGRFRPNLVVTGCAPYAEDTWSRIKIGTLGLRLIKPCSRCVITTIDPTTGDKGMEPLKTLSSYRRKGNKVYFGQNLNHDGQGHLSLGMPVWVS
ncbi:MAG: MOSC domain-containing protein [Gammaproteobacteria bacterium]|nr:MOSC domain-containing protein [Gammaproteobacteria bacterium]